MHISCSALVHVYVGVCVGRVHVSACERGIESLVFGRWIENARLNAPIPCFFVLLMHVCNSCCSNCTSCCLLCKPERCLINLESYSE